MTKPKSTAIIFKNVASDGTRELLLLRRDVAAGEEFEVTPEQAVALYPQPDVWALVEGLDLFENLLPVDEPDEPVEIVEPAIDEAVLPLTPSTEGK